MSDFRTDPNFPRGDIHQYDSRVQWAAVAVILLLLGGLIVAATWTGEGIQSASTTSPAIETTGSGAPMGSAQTMPTPPRQLRH
jgi:hypothetical protein